jgi:hypothetical protein
MRSHILRGPFADVIEAPLSVIEAPPSPSSAAHQESELYLAVRHPGKAAGAHAS